MPWIDANGNKYEPHSRHHFNPEAETVEQLLTTESAGAGIELTFENFGDGKPFSWASTLRKKGYDKAILGGGTLGIDRVFYAFRCGFSFVWLSDEEYASLLPIHLAPFSDNYQPSPGDQGDS